MPATSEQKRIINAPLDRNIKVVAVAGSGKTFTLIGRVMHLLKNEVASEKIIIIMFNKSARDDFEARIQAKVSEHNTKYSTNLKAPDVFTYHGLGSRIIKKLVASGSLPQARLETNPFAVSDMAKEALLLASKKQRPNTRINYRVVDEFVGFIDIVKSSLHNPERIFKQFEYPEKLDIFPCAFDEFERLRKSSGIRFFSDLIYDPVRAVLKGNLHSPIIGEFEHIIGDEYQDINPISQKLIEIITTRLTKLTVCGDDDQTIYTFRGSDPSYLISRFDKIFGEPLLFKLTRTFRYGSEISLISNNIISKNDNRINKLCVSANPAMDTSIELHVEERNGEHIVRTINSLQKDGYKLKDIMLLVRSYSTTPAIEIELLDKGIPYTIDGTKPVTQSPDILALRALALWASNKTLDTNDELLMKSFAHIFSLPVVGIRREVALDIAMIIVKYKDDYEAYLNHIKRNVHDFVWGQVLERCQYVLSLLESNALTSIENIQWYLNKTNCFENIKKQSVNDIKADEQISTIQSWIKYILRYADTSQKQIETMNRFLELKPNDSDSDHITLTSIHKSKGLEWPVVILPDVRDGVFPYIQKGRTCDIESERRLFYVACTRAENRLLIIVPNDKCLFKQVQSMGSEMPYGIEGNRDLASRFLYEGNLGLVKRVCTSEANNVAQLSAPHSPEIEICNEYLCESGSDLRVFPR